jgi:imidazoleglycerol-phosphate dehydratase / histidinol-phosphatase
MAKNKILFIDRDGTLIWEPQDNFRVDTFEKLRFMPGVLFYLRKISMELDYELVMVTNQDGLGTESYPEKTFWAIQDFVMKTINSERIAFHNVFIDRSFAHENKPTRKPGTAMLTHYLEGGYDLANSFVIGDSIVDIQLAKNLGSKMIFMKNYDSPVGYEKDISAVVDSWEKIYDFLKQQNS